MTENAEKMGKILREQLAPGGMITAVRGKGLLNAIEIKPTGTKSMLHSSI